MPLNGLLRNVACTSWGYLRSCSLSTIRDTILDRYTLDAVENPRLQRMKERLSPYIFKTVWRKGKNHSIPGALSRAPVNNPSAEDQIEECGVVSQIHAVITSTVNATSGADENSPAHLADPLL